MSTDAADTALARTAQPTARELAPALPAWLDRAEWPFAPRYFTPPHGAGPMHYIDEGTGPAVVMVHGTPVWSFLYRGLIARLRGRYRCVAADHVGFGLSHKPRVGLRPEQHAQNLAALIDALGLRDVTLVVHDFGGPIGLAYAVARPENVARIVVANTWMWPTADDPRVVRLSRLVASPVGRVLYKWLNASARWLIPASFADRAKLTREVHAHYTQPFARRRDREGPWALGCALAGSSDFYGSLWAKRERLARVPMRFVWGTRDPAITEQHLRRWTEAFPRAEVTTLDAGHFLQEEQPDEYVRAVESFLEPSPPGVK